MPETEDCKSPQASWNPVMGEELGSFFELTGSNLDGASSPSSVNSGDILHPSANGRLDNCRAWTNEMHNKFLDSLEASFVQQLHHSKGLLAWCKEYNRGDTDVPCRFPVGLNKASEQFAHLRDDGWQKMIIEKNQPLSYVAAVEIPWMHYQEVAVKVSPLLSADPKGCNGLYNRKEHLKGKRSIYNEPEILEQNACRNPYYHNPVGSLKEGSGQNFVDETCEDSSKVFSLAKRLKTAVEDS